MQDSPGPVPPREQALPPAGQHGATGCSRSLSSTELFQGGRSVEITHNGLVYRLQTTKLGKLILTK
jgi:hemin uptake protein HemP